MWYSRVLGLLAISTLGSCAGVTDTSIEGVSPQQAMDISAAIGAQEHARHVYSCHRWPDGGIVVETDVGDFEAQRVGKGWKFSRLIITGKKA